MSELRLETLEIPAARLGPPNPLAALHAYHTVTYQVSEDAYNEQPPYVDQGNEASILPYTWQDDYDRNRIPRKFKVAVLENEYLRATFMLELGGRLWSLYHKPARRELLEVNPVFQPANLATRDAWFTGGVEWNVSIIGHCPLTCSPLFAGKVIASDGTPILRLWEFERIRAVPFQVDAYLPDGSPFLFVRPRIFNPHEWTIPMYWWSNIAVHETEEIRVLAPAHDAYYHAYDRSLQLQTLPMRDGLDMSYSTRIRPAGDLYFRIPPQQRPWIAAVEPDGGGIIHTSTQRMIGRKMFNWGMASGGRRWKAHLAVPGSQYLEIQGGLATKQTQYVAMPAGANWQWLEAYGLLEADPKQVHSSDWQTALRHVDERLESILPRESLDRQLERLGPDADRPPAEIYQTGSGWGALENQRRARSGSKSVATAGTPFPDATIGEEQQPWMHLLNKGELPSRRPDEPPGAYMTQPEWKDLLEASIANGQGVHWLSLLHLGTMRYRARDMAGARDAWERSLELSRSSWALRSLAVLADDERDKGRAADLWLEAARLLPEFPPLVIEACEALLRAGRFKEIVEFVRSLSDVVKENGRIRLLNAVAALRDGDFSPAKEFFSRPFDIANIREGELSVSEMWFEWHETELARREGKPVDETIRQAVRREFPVPDDFEFRMTLD